MLQRLSLNDILRKNRGTVGDVESGVRYYEKGFSPADIATIRKRVKMMALIYLKYLRGIAKVAGIS